MHLLTTNIPHLILQKMWQEFLPTSSYQLRYLGCFLSTASAQSLDTSTPLMADGSVPPPPPPDPMPDVSENVRISVGPTMGALLMSSGELT